MTDDARTEVQRESLLGKLKSWAADNGVTHVAIRQLMSLLNEEIPNIKLPIDGRTLMETDRTTKKQLLQMSSGQYWNYDVEWLLVNALTYQQSNDTNNMTIQLKINIDG